MKSKTVSHLSTSIACLLRFSSHRRSLRIWRICTELGHMSRLQRISFIDLNHLRLHNDNKQWASLDNLWQNDPPASEFNFQDHQKRRIYISTFETTRRLRGMCWRSNRFRHCIRSRIVFIHVTHRFSQK